MMRFGDRETVRENLYAAISLLKIWDVNVDNIVKSKLV